MAEAPAVPVALTPVGVGKSPLIPFPDNPSVGGWTKQVTCRYFIHGVCKEGNNCRYSHDLATSRSNAICRFYQRGCCRYGDKCRYGHPDPLREAQDWVNVEEFVPHQGHHKHAPSDQDIQGALSPELKANLKKRICPYAAVGQCRYGVNCYYSHGDPCDMCGLQVLHPTDMAQRSEHIKNCIDAHEKDMELSFAIQRSKDVVCGICMEVVYEKANLSERRFGILSNCKHSYCLTCIQRWRDAKHRENNFIKSCPECDIKSNFVIPSEYWVVEKDEKEKLIRKNNEAIRYEHPEPPRQVQDWINAKVLVPHQDYYRHALSGENIQGALSPELKANLKKRICPYDVVGECRYGVNCYYSHGDPCDMCGLQVLHPTDMTQRSEHIKLCIERREKKMAVQHSKDVVCGICMEVVYEKTNLSERRFGILSNCKHSYCLTCIRRWRDAKYRENNFIKSCPQCHIKSNFVIPSEYWVVEKDKKKLIRKYKEAMRNESCYYFAKYRSNCPLGDGCFFKHVYPDGPLEDQRREETWQAQHRNPVWEFEESESRDDGQVLILLSEMLSVGLEVEDDDKDPKDE